MKRNENFSRNCNFTKKIEIFCECKIELFDGNTNETQGTCMKSITDEKP